jgi:hypothetical protein
VDGSQPKDPVAVAAALRSMASVAALAEELAPLGIPLLVLKGPHVQRRLLGSPAAYISADVDLLVRRRDGGATRRHLRSTGWTFAAENGRLWRLDGAAAFGRDGVVVDLHWGLHAGLLPATALRPIEQAMWDSAEELTPNLVQPRLEALVAYLAVHHAVTPSPGKARLLQAAAADPTFDREETLALAARCRLRSTAGWALDAAPPPPPSATTERYGRLAPFAVGWRAAAVRASRRT